MLTMTMSIEQLKLIYPFQVSTRQSTLTLGVHVEMSVYVEKYGIRKKFTNPCQEYTKATGT